MTVKELIKMLESFDPETEVIGACTDPTNYTYKVPIESIELDDPFDSNGYSGIDGTEMDYSEVWDEDEETGEETYIGPKAVVINLGNV